MAAPTSVVVLDRGNNTTCTINLHGATVVSWRVNNQEQLFVSKQAVFDGKQPIRGGIPFVFPQFGPWAYGPHHGFAQIICWNLEKGPERLPSGDVEAIFSSMDSEWTRSIWNYPFRLTYRLILREKELHFIIGVYNPSKDITFSFNLLLHTYFKVPDVRRCQITGLHGCTFIDKTRDGAIYQEGRESVTISEWTDRIYQNTPQEHIITNVVSGRKMRIQKYNFPDTVVWNPWADHSKDYQDFGDDEFPNMICVESGHVSSPVVLLPGTAFEASQILQTQELEMDSDFVDQQLLQQFSCLGTTDKDELINQLKALVGNNLSTTSAKFFLDMNNWNLQAAVGSYFDFGTPAKLPSMCLIKDNINSEMMNVPPATQVTKVWVIMNNGDEEWPNGCYMQFSGGDFTNLYGLRIPVCSITPNQTTQVSVDLMSPSQPGVYKSKWRLTTPTGSYFGDTIWIIMTVSENDPSDLATQLSNLNTFGDSAGHRADAGYYVNPFGSQLGKLPE